MIRNGFLVFDDDDGVRRAVRAVDVVDIHEDTDGSCFVMTCSALAFTVPDTTIDALLSHGPAVVQTPRTDA